MASTSFLAMHACMRRVWLLLSRSLSLSLSLSLLLLLLLLLRGLPCSLTSAARTPSLAAKTRPPCPRGQRRPS
jgi:hypothetical protein